MTDIALDTEINVKEKIKEIVKEPERYKVLFLNDDHTPMDFVVSLLVEVFRHSEKTAQELTMKIHSDGQAVVGVYSFEIAEQKSIEATKLSRENGFPLQIAIEKE
jgi:ATP-dependent Clp protease adaptor protein ClpS|tara:strand:+ start:206 stop:520 length:315 start_codon:yes stop_codon:yes gene_type:complete